MLAGTRVHMQNFLHSTSIVPRHQIGHHWRRGQCKWTRSTFLRTRLIAHHKIFRLYLPDTIQTFHHLGYRLVDNDSLRIVQQWTKINNNLQSMTVEEAEKEVE
jgi:hypothetical protein